MGFILLLLISHQVFFKNTRNWSSVIIGYEDESLFHVYVSFGMSLGFKLNGNSQSGHAFSALALAKTYVYQEIESSSRF